MDLRFKEGSDFVRFELKEDKFILHLKGKIIMNNSDSTKNEIKEILTKEGVTKNSIPVILDLRELEMLDSTGVGVIISIYKFLSEKNISLNLTNPQSIVKKVLSITKIDTIIEIV